MTTGWMQRGGYAVGKYQGFDIYRDEEHGLYWQEDGFFDCFKDVWDSIEDFNAEYDPFDVRSMDCTANRFPANRD
jgi:hypothetical protein